MPSKEVFATFDYHNRIVALMNTREEFKENREYCYGREDSDEVKLMKAPAVKDAYNAVHNEDKPQHDEYEETYDGNEEGVEYPEFGNADDLDRLSAEILEKYSTFGKALLCNPTFDFGFRVYSNDKLHRHNKLCYCPLSKPGMKMENHVQF